MGNLRDIFNYACNNDIKALNNSIKNVGRKHHAAYMTNMMFDNDIDINNYLLHDAQNLVNSLYNTISDNYCLKKNIKDIICNQYEFNLMITNELDFLNDNQIFNLVYQQALKYYFRIEIDNDQDYKSYFEEAIKYRIVSNFMQNEIEDILLKVHEDIEIINEDTNNLNFLFQNYKRINNNDTYNLILKLITDSITNTVLQNKRFDTDYFTVVRKLNNVIESNLKKVGNNYGTVRNNFII